MKGFITPAVIIAVATLAFGGSYIAWKRSQVPQESFGADPFVFTSGQVGSDPDSGDCLTTDGTFSTWSDSCGEGGPATGGGLASSTPWTPGQLAAIVDDETLTGVSTTSLTASSPLSLSNAISVIGSSASALSLDTSGAWTGNAGTASALFANGSNCLAGLAAGGVNASGAAEDCTDYWTEAENTSAAYISSVVADYPLQGLGTSGSHLSLAFGTTTSNTWAGTQTFTNSPLFSVLTAGTVNSRSDGTIYNTATSTPTFGNGLSYSGVAGDLIGGSSGTLTVTLGTTIAPSELVGQASFATNQVLSVNTGAGTFFSTATSTPTVTYPVQYSGTLGSFVGGSTGAFSLAFGTTTNNTWSGTNVFTATTTHTYIINGAGSPGSPSYTFGSDLNTGMYQITNDRIGFSVNATNIVDIRAAAFEVKTGITSTLLGQGTAIGSTFIATTPPSQGLIVQGLTGIGSSTPYASLSLTNTGSNPTLVLEDATSPDSTPFMIDASGRVGIGTTTPHAKLGVTGEGTALLNTFLAANSNNTPILTVQDNGTTTISGTSAATSTAYIYSTAAGKGGSIILEDVDGAGCTSVSALNGVLSAITVTCPTE